MIVINIIIAYILIMEKKKHIFYIDVSDIKSLVKIVLLFKNNEKKQQEQQQQTNTNKMKRGTYNFNPFSFQKQNGIITGRYEKPL